VWGHNPNDEYIDEDYCQCEMDYGGCACVISWCTVQRHGGAVKSIAWSPCGERVATGSKDMSVVLWDSRSGEAELRPDRTGDLAGGRWDFGLIEILGA